MAVLLRLPALIGVFWGAPLITRELEAGTHRLVWNQSVTRTRWLATKLGLTGLAAMAAAGLLSLAVTWWASPIDAAVDAGRSRDRGDPAPAIDAAGVRRARHRPHRLRRLRLRPRRHRRRPPRRTLPAMAITLAVFAAVQIAMPLRVRPHLAAPTGPPADHQAEPHASASRANAKVTLRRPGAWITSQQTVNAAGHPAAPPSAFADCTSVPRLRCRPHQLGYQQQVTYQPAGNFWALQGAETGIYLGLALGLAPSAPGGSAAVCPDQSLVRPVRSRRRHEGAARPAAPSLRLTTLPEPEEYRCPSAGRRAGHGRGEVEPLVHVEAESFRTGRCSTRTARSVRAGPHRTVP